MEKLSSGYVIVGAYANKIRRVTFAQLKDKIKAGELTNEEVAKQVGELNSYLFNILVNELGLDKGDIVRIKINYEVKDGKIVFDYESLEIEAFKRIPIELNIKLEEIASNDMGEKLYAIKKNDEVIGYISMSKLNGKAIIKGAISKPPKVINPVEVVLKDDKLPLSEIFYHAVSDEEEKVNKIIEELKGEFNLE